MATKTLYDAATTVMEAENTALDEIRTALANLEAAFVETCNKLDFPVGYSSMAKQIVSEIRSNLSYRTQQINTILSPPVVPTI